MTTPAKQRDLFASNGRPLSRHEQAFREFHEANPHVYDEIVKLCRIVTSHGRDRWSINGIFEVLRWSQLRTDTEDYKLNNNYRAFYARMVMENEPDLDGFFQLRERDG